MVSAPEALSHGADEAGYRRLFPYYAEVCALTEIRKRPGFGVPLHSGIGGHSVMYLHGVRRDKRDRYPVLELCDADAGPHDGVGISVNSHFSNANWVAVEGRDFVWRGALEPGERLTRAAYERTQDLAKAMGVLDGIVFHEELFRDCPPGMSRRDYMYEISIATDYAMNFGRDIMRVRVPLDRARMAALIGFLNGLNAPYRDGGRVYRWRVLNDNCSHVTHNALASAGIWAEWPIGQFFLRAAFGFPVPKNEFVDLVGRANDLPIEDAQAMFDDGLTRRALFETGALPTAPGALAAAERAIGDNDVFDTERLRLIFYDNPFWGPYRSRLARIFREPRYVDLRANFDHFAAIYRAAAEGSRSVNAGAMSGERAQFQAIYERYVEQAAARLSQHRARLEQRPELPAMVAP